LWSPTVTDYAASASSLWSGFANETVANSWFSANVSVNPNKNLPKTCSPSFTSSPADCTDAVSTVFRAKKIRIKPNRAQERVLKQWLGIARYVYNLSVDHGVTNRMSRQVEILGMLPAWADSAPYKVKQMAIEDAAVAKKNLYKFRERTGCDGELKHRRKRDRRDSIYIPKEAIKPDAIYVRTLGRMKFTEPIQKPTSDCRLLHDNGRYYLLVPYNKPKRDNQADGLVSVDPGVRTFVTFFSEQLVGKLGEQDINRIQRLCYYMDGCISRKKWRAVRNLRTRIRNLVSELHHKVAIFLVKNFRTIVLPAFDAGAMSIRTKRKINSKTARAMLTLAHSRFRDILLHKAEEWNRVVVHVSEAYTSKTCSVCGTMHDIGGRKVLNCCQKFDRDINGARGIFLRALEDNPCGREPAALKEPFSACLEMST
jgi:putative transposase